jgi:hypothetical protein
MGVEIVGAWASVGAPRPQRKVTAGEAPHEFRAELTVTGSVSRFGYNAGPHGPIAGQEMREPVVEAVIEALAELGCRAVLEVIEALEQGRTLPETRDLEPDEAHRVLEELKSVMAVYGDRCRR